MIKAFLFDMDGVLYDSMPHHAEAWYATMHDRLGFECDRTHFYMMEGATGEQTIGDLFRRQRGVEVTHDEAMRIYAEKSAAFVALGKAEPMRGAAEVLRRVVALGLGRVLVTGSGQASLLDRLEADYPGVFSRERMVTAHDTPAGRGKPHPDPYLMGLEKAGGLRPEEAVVVENAPLGVRAARAAGIFTIAVNTGPLDPQVLREAGADIVLSGMQELADRLDEIRMEYGLL